MGSSIGGLTSQKRLATGRSGGATKTTPRPPGAGPRTGAGSGRPAGAHGARGARGVGRGRAGRRRLSAAAAAGHGRQAVRHSCRPTPNPARLRRAAGSRHQRRPATTTPPWRARPRTRRAAEGSCVGEQRRARLRARVRGVGAGLLVTRARARQQGLHRGQGGRLDQEGQQSQSCCSP